MIINAQTIIVTILIISVAFYVGLQVVRRFALTIAQENHDANIAEDKAEEAKRLRRERDADAAASAAFAKVEPMLANGAAAAMAGAPSSGTSSAHLELEPSPSADVTGSAPTSGSANV